jgi:hypothetical protein
LMKFVKRIIVAVKPHKGKTLGVHAVSILKLRDNLVTSSPSR